MKHIPVLFNPEMVRALHAPRPKTNTRRLHRLGEPGDILWGKESYRLLPCFDICKPRDVLPTMVFYEATGDIETHPEADIPLADAGAMIAGGFGKLRPSMFMCRWMSRISLELTAVHEMPLQAISEADARAEGVEPMQLGPMSDADSKLLDLPLMDPARPYAVAYALLWDKLNGIGSWASNPTVYSHHFRSIE